MVEDMKQGRLAAVARLWGPALLGMVLLGGCAFARGNVGDELRPEDVAQIRKGESTRAEVAVRLGAPDRIIEINGHEIFQYYRYDVKVGNLLVFSRMNIASDDLYVRFNQAGIVDDVVFGKRTEKLEFQFWPFGD